MLWHIRKRVGAMVLQHRYLRCLRELRHFGRATWRRLRTGLLPLLSASFGLGFILHQAAAGCVPVAGLAPRLIPAALGPVAPGPGQVGLTFLGHASFLLETSGGVTAVTDYSGQVGPGFVPDVVTMNRAHPSHYTDTPDPAIKFVLRGWDPTGAAARHDVKYRDLRIRNVATNIRDYNGGTLLNGNSIFIFETADLCIAHLGHLHHLLTPGHLAELGQIDVLLVPVDGAYTLEQVDMLTVMASIRAPLMIPMHYFSNATLGAFLDKARARYPVRVSDSPSLLLSRTMLPRQPEILVLPGAS